MEQRVSCEHCLLIAVLREPADAVLCVAGRVEALHGNTPDLETFAIGRGQSDGFTILAADDGEVRRS